MLKYSLYFMIFYMLFADVLIATQGMRGVSRLNDNNNNNNNKGLLGRGYYGDRGYKQKVTQPTTDDKGSKPNVRYSQARHRLSAWGIIGIVIAMIAMATVIYYLVICFPIVCRHERKYDTMELDAV